MILQEALQEIERTQEKLLLGAYEGLYMISAFEERDAEVIPSEKTLYSDTMIGIAPDETSFSGKPVITLAKHSKEYPDLGPNYDLAVDFDKKLCHQKGEYILW